MDIMGSAFFENIFRIIQEGRADDAPLIEFKHPKELEVSETTTADRIAKLPPRSRLVKLSQGPGVVGSLVAENT